MSRQQAEGWAFDLFGVRGTAAPLPGYEDRNFLLDGGGEGRWVLKVAHSTTRRSEVECQLEALRFLASTSVAGFVPAVCATHHGDLSTQVETASCGLCFIRLVSYLEGTPMVEFGDPGSDLRAQTGRLLGRLDHHLLNFDHPGAHRHLTWDLVNFLELEPYLRYLDQEMMPIIEEVFDRFRRRVAPHLDGLRRSVIQNDGNDHNLLVSTASGAPRLCGLIDFGDLVFTITVAEPAIAAAYAMLAAEDPAAAANEIRLAFEKDLPLTEHERRLMPDLSLARLATSLLSAAQAKQASPEDAYLQVTDQPARRVLKMLV